MSQPPQEEAERVEIVLIGWRRNDEYEAAIAYRREPQPVAGRAETSAAPAEMSVEPVTDPSTSAAPRPPG